MAEQINKRGMVLFDLDNCVFDDRWRMNLIRSGLEFAISSDDSRFDEYHAKMDGDAVNPIARKYLDDAIKNDMFVVFVTARPIRYQDITIWQLTEVLGLRKELDFKLYMRPTGDHRGSAELKLEVAAALQVEAAANDVSIVGAFDDRQDVVSAYQSLGIPAFILNCERCDAPMIQDVTPIALEEFQNRLIEATTSSDMPQLVAPGAQSNEHRPQEIPQAAPTSVRESAQADGPTQPQYAQLADVLERMGATSRERYAVYGDNANKIGAVMQALFPNGFTARTPADHRMISHLDRIVSKLTRFVNSGCTHVDSIHDIAPYAAMAEMEVPFHSLEYRP